MHKKPQYALSANKTERFIRVALIGLAMLLIFATLFTVTTPELFAKGVAVNNAALDGVMNTVLGIIQTASKYVGAVIVLWGVFQIIMALRREDSEAIGKQITTVVVGAVLLGFGLTAQQLFNSILSTK